MGTYLGWHLCGANISVNTKTVLVLVMVDLVSVCFFYMCSCFCTGIMQFSRDYPGSYFACLVHVLLSQLIFFQLLASWWPSRKFWYLFVPSSMVQSNTITCSIYEISTNNGLITSPGIVHIKSRVCCSLLSLNAFFNLMKKR